MIWAAVYTIDRPYSQSASLSFQHGKSGSRLNRDQIGVTIGNRKLFLEIYNSSRCIDFPLPPKNIAQKQNSQRPKYHTKKDLYLTWRFNNYLIVDDTHDPVIINGGRHMFGDNSLNQIFRSDKIFYNIHDWNTTIA